MSRKVKVKRSDMLTGPHPSAEASANPEFLFVHLFEGETWALKEGLVGVYARTLIGSMASSTYVSDRPDRIVGITPIRQFQDGLGFAPANPPNAALDAHTEKGDQDINAIEEKLSI